MLLTLLWVVPVFAQEGEAEAPKPPAIREIVEAGNYLFQRAFADRDARALSDLYTEDARVIPPGGTPVVGREAIAAFWQAQMETLLRVELRTDDVDSDGDLAAEQGNATLLAADGSEIGIQYVVVWKRIGRRWHLHRDIWNAAPERPADAAAPGAPQDAPAPSEPAPPGPDDTSAAVEGNP